MAIDLPTDAHDAIVSNPAVAEALTHSSRRYTIIGVAPGQTDAVFLDSAGRTILSLRIRVDAGVYALQDSINRVAPGSQAHAEALNDSVILTGMVTSPGEADRVVQVARAFVSAPEKVLNMMTVAGSDQVTLKVRIQAFERVGLVRTLAEPNLTVVSGEAGKFLVGGEFPVPTAQDVTAASPSSSSPTAWAWATPRW
jgi:pilus assembly protein CpaC